MSKSEDPQKKADGQSEKSPSVSSGGAFPRVLLKAFILAFLSAYAAAAILAHCPADLSEIKGYSTDETSASAPSPDLTQRLSDAVATRLEPIALKEEEVNAYIARHLNAKQIGYSENYVTFRGVWVDFAENRCRIFMEREVFGRPNTIAIELKITREGDQFLTQFTGGQFGRLKVTQGFLLLVKHAYDRLATQVFSNELDLIFQMNQIRFDEDQLVLDPRFPQSAS